MRTIKQGLAVFLALILMLPPMPVSASQASITAEETVNVVESEEESVAESSSEEISTGEVSESVDTSAETEVTTTEENSTTEGTTEETEESLVSEEETVVTAETTEETTEEITTETVSETTEEATEVVSTEETTEAEAETTEETVERETVYYNTGNRVIGVSAVNDSKEKGKAYFEEDGSYTINIPEKNPFFPYEVQFTYEDEVTNEWFMTPDDSVEIGGHTFYVSANFDNKVVTQMSLDIAGKTVVVYPEEKNFTDGLGVSPASLLPLEERDLFVNLRGFTPVELTMVSFDSIFTGENALEDTDQIVWKEERYDNADEYVINASGDVYDFSNSTSNYEMIVGDSDQLASGNIRYLVYMYKTSASNWLIPSLYTQDSDGKRKDVTLSSSGFSNYDRDNYREYMYANEEEVGDAKKAYIGLNINPELFSDVKFESFKVYEGKYQTAQEAMAGKDITNALFASDMSQKNAGYFVEKNVDTWVTMVTYADNGNVSGCLPFYIEWRTNSAVNNHTSSYLYGDSRESVNYSSRSSYEKDIKVTTYELYKEFPADKKYSVYFYYYQNGSSNNGSVTAAYVGNYATIAEATRDGATDIKSTLFDSSAGYEADFSKGVYFTIFVGEDGSDNQEVYKECIKTVTGTQAKYKLDSSAFVTFTGFSDGDGNYISAYQVDSNDDSYANYNYLSVLVGKDTDLTNLAPTFNTKSTVKLYAPGSSSPITSGTEFFDFSQGAVQFTTASEDGTNSKNYWVQVVKASDEVNNLYINSLADEKSQTKEENNIIYSNREIILDSQHDNRHDILFANMSTSAIDALSVELDSDVLALDEYWTLSGDYDLSGFSTTETNQSYGELPNLAKVRLRAKDGNSTDVAGTLTIKSGDTTIMVLSLNGVIGSPSIVTEEIPEAVKYVPYGTMIQNNNSYEWNDVTYSLVSGKLPAGMEVKPNGEIYGVPKKSGTFTFTVKMDNSDNTFKDCQKQFTLKVVENTDANVDGATDTGYDLSQRVQDVDANSTGTQTLVSEGEFTQFVDIYLDGVKLVEGVDYTAESGSTRITIQNQTLTGTGNGDHTLGIEFRDGDDALKRAAQNYTNTANKDNSGGGNGTGTGTGDNGNANGNGNGNNTGGNGANPGKGGSIGIPLKTPGVPVITDPNNTITYVIESGDTLWSIAEKYYGSGEYWTLIYELNKNTISNPNRIYVGQTILINMALKSTNAIIEGTTYTVQSGDTLWKIAEMYYGKGWQWRKIYQANGDTITAPERIYVGQVIVIPE